MTIFLATLGGFVVWFFVGCLLGAGIDTYEGNHDLFHWCEKCPLGFFTAVMVWPAWLAIYLCTRQKLR